MGARWYDPELGRFVQPDTIVPEPKNPQALDRYAYVSNNPIKHIDPTGHQGEVPPLLQQAVAFFEGQGWRVVGDPRLINPYWNMADLVFTAEEGLRVLAVELKDVAGSVNLGTLGLSKNFPDYGGSLMRLSRSSLRFYNSSVSLLKDMSQTVRTAFEAGTLENALFTSSRVRTISANAQAQFEGVYRLGEEGQVLVEKTLNKVKEPSFWAKAGATWQATKTLIQSTTTTLGNISKSIIIDPIIIPLDPNWYEEYEKYLPQKG
jgi:hypothetical protein